MKPFDTSRPAKEPHMTHGAALENLEQGMTNGGIFRLEEYGSSVALIASEKAYARARHWINRNGSRKTKPAPFAISMVTF